MFLKREKQDCHGKGKSWKTGKLDVYISRSGKRGEFVWKCNKREFTYNMGDIFKIKNVPGL